jgi:putative heme-binding domain-containing protein
MSNWALKSGLTALAVCGILSAQVQNGGPRPKTASQVNVPGDAAQGQAIFNGKGVCLSCHRVGDRGSRMGPNLSDIATKQTVDELRQALLSPNPEVDPANRSYRVVTADGKTITGKLLNQDVYSLQMLDAKEQLVAFQKAGLREYGFAPTPAMPSYQDKLSAAEQTDVIAYLATLTGVVKQ